MRVSLEAQQRIPKVSKIVAQRVHAGKSSSEPSGQQIDLRRNPYIPTKSATMKAEKPPNVRQSLFVFGLKELKAKMMKTAELMSTRDHIPYARISCA